MALRFHARSASAGRRHLHLIGVQSHASLSNDDVAGIGAGLAVEIGEKAVGIHRDGLIGIEPKILRALARWGRRGVSHTYRSEPDSKNGGGKFLHGKVFRNGTVVVLSSSIWTLPEN